MILVVITVSYICRNELADQNRARWFNMKCSTPQTVATQWTDDSYPSRYFTAQMIAQANRHRPPIVNMFGWTSVLVSEIYELMDCISIEREREIKRALRHHVVAFRLGFLPFVLPIWRFKVSLGFVQTPYIGKWRYCNRKRTFARID